MRLRSDEQIRLSCSFLTRSELVHRTSISSMNRIVLSRVLARSKISRSLASDPPEYIELKSGPLTQIKFGWSRIAGRDFPSKVLPEPEGPCKRMPTKDL